LRTDSSGRERFRDETRNSCYAHSDRAHRPGDNGTVDLGEGVEGVIGHQQSQTLNERQQCLHSGQVGVRDARHQQWADVTGEHPRAPADHDPAGHCHADGWSHDDRGDAQRRATQAERRTSADVAHSAPPRDHERHDNHPEALATGDQTGSPGTPAVVPGQERVQQGCHREEETRGNGRQQQRRPQYRIFRGEPYPVGRIQRRTTRTTAKVPASAAAAPASPAVATSTPPSGGAVWALGEIGPGVVPLLREVRRSRTAGWLRRAALEALAAVGGPAAFDARDRDPVRRLIKMRITAETPEPVHLCGSWFAIPTGDQAAVLDAFGLSDPEPVTMRFGASAWNHDHHDWTGPGKEHRECSRVYVSPRLDGWILVFGRPAEDAHRADPDGDEDAWSDVVRDRCRMLSRRFGVAHWYGMSCGDDWTACASPRTARSSASTTPRA
jgi:hypothetical protein